MIKLKPLAKKISAEKKSTSWLTSDGIFIPVNYNHGSEAARITGTNNDPMMILWKKGWQRVTYYSYGTLFANNEVMPPNDLQKRLLIDLTKELNFDELKFDSGDGSYILWSSADVLEFFVRK